MTKRLFTLAALLMLALTGIQAQSLVGKWKADNSFKQELQSETGLDCDMFMEFGQSTMAVSFDATVKEDDATVSMKISLPGTYKRNGNTVNCRFDESKFSVEIVDFDTTDPEMRELLANPEMKKLILEMAKDAIKKESGTVEAFKPFTNAFKSFTISTLTSDKINIVLVDADDGDTIDVTFNRVK